LQHIGTMDAQQSLPKVPDSVKFRVLIIGRANAGKTSILQRVCDTTESPEIYGLGPQGQRERVRFSFLAAPLISSSSQVELEASQQVGQAYSCR
jgi:GTPase SAR1 family protein